MAKLSKKKSTSVMQ